MWTRLRFSPSMTKRLLRWSSGIGQRSCATGLYAVSSRNGGRRGGGETNSSRAPFDRHVLQRNSHEHTSRRVVLAARILFPSSPLLLISIERSQAQASSLGLGRCLCVAQSPGSFSAAHPPSSHTPQPAKARPQALCACTPSPLEQLRGVPRAGVGKLPRTYDRRKGNTEESGGSSRVRWTLCTKHLPFPHLRGVRRHQRACLHEGVLTLLRGTSRPLISGTVCGAYLRRCNCWPVVCCFSPRGAQSCVPVRTSVVIHGRPTTLPHPLSPRFDEAASRSSRFGVFLLNISFPPLKYLFSCLLRTTHTATLSYSFHFISFKILVEFWPYSVSLFLVSLTLSCPRRVRRTRLSFSSLREFSARVQVCRAPCSRIRACIIHYLCLLENSRSVFAVTASSRRSCFDAPFLACFGSELNCLW